MIVPDPALICLVHELLAGSLAHIDDMRQASKLLNNLCYLRNGSIEDGDRFNSNWPSGVLINHLVRPRDVPQLPFHSRPALPDAKSSVDDRELEDRTIGIGDRQSPRIRFQKAIREGQDRLGPTEIEFSGIQRSRSKREYPALRKAELMRIWLEVDPATLVVERYLWFGGSPGTRLPALGPKISRHSHANSASFQAERRRIGSSANHILKR